MRRGERSVEIVVGIEDATEGGGHDREILRLAAGHHGIGRERLQGRHDLARQHGRVGAVVAPHRLDELRDLGLGRDIERHAVAPALFGGELVERLDVHIVEVDHLLLGDILHFVVASLSPLVAASMRSRSSSALRPPIGCFTHDQPWFNLAGLRLSEDQRLESLSWRSRRP